MNTGEEIQDVLEALPDRVRKIVTGSESREKKLLEISRMLKDTVPAYDWVGFYLVDPEADQELVLGPYVGAPTDHVRIPFGRGICGQAAETMATFVVDDVTAEDNYLACSVDVKSEIVLPIIKGDKLIGELDIDSHQKAGFTEIDETILKKICEIITQLF